MSKAYKISTAIGILLLLFIATCRICTPLADAYSLYLYPAISGSLSLISSVAPISFQDLAITAIIASAIIAMALCLRKRYNWKRCVRYELTILLWTYVWFYISWCNNYSRSSIFARTSTQMTEYNDSAFRSFIHTFAEEINDAWTADILADRQRLEAEVKAFYSAIPSTYGLSSPQSYQHPKVMTFSRFYSAVGVQGFMAPLFSESFINADVLPFDYPFVYAHEYSHLLGISSEAEANWWAYHACVSSQDAAIRYSGYKGIVSHVIRNARNFLPESDYNDWMSTLRPEVMSDLMHTQEHWAALHSPILNDLQDTIYDLFLKSNKVSSGKKNYSEVIQILISLPPPSEQQEQ